MNLLKETIEVLNRHDKQLSDIIFIRHYQVYSFQQPTCNCKVTEAELKTLLDFEYDNGYGGAEINQNFELVGKDFWLERHEYDGSEWWEYKQQPIYDESIKCDLANFPLREVW